MCSPIRQCEMYSSLYGLACNLSAVTVVIIFTLVMVTIWVLNLEGIMRRVQLMKSCKKTSFKAGSSFDSSGLYVLQCNSLFSMPHVEPANNRVDELARIIKMVGKKC
jgi:hypothetical protein